MQTTEALKRRIDTAEDLAAVVRTMKTLAAVNIRQYEAAADLLQAYEQTIRAAVQMVVWNDPRLASHRQNSGAAHDGVERRRSESPRLGLIVFGSDQGMCGGFNDAIASYVHRLLEEREIRPPAAPLIVLGRRLAARLADEGRHVDDTIDLPGAATGITLMLQELLPRIDRWREAYRLEAVTVCHNRRLSQTHYEPVQRRLLPISPADLAGPALPRWPGRSLPLVTIPPQNLWQSIVRQHVFVLLFQACAESQASENAARIAAMQAAETHIHDRLGELNRDYQQLRQTSITEELLDVISGFEALSGEG